MSEPIEASLLQRAKDGEPGAWEALVDRLRIRLWLRAKKLARTDADAEDLVQMTWLRLLEVDPPRHSSNFVGWVSTIMNHLFLDKFVRKSKRCRPVGLDQDVRNPPEAEPDFEPDLIEVLHELIQQLPDVQRRAIQMKYWEKKSNPEICAGLTMGYDRLAGLLHRVKIRLREQIRSQRPEIVDVLALDVIEEVNHDKRSH